MAENIIEQIENAEDKDSLVSLAESLGQELSKRKGLETLRAELLEAAEASQSGGQEGDEGKTGGDAQGQAKTSQKAAKGAEKPKGRRLKNLNNGRVFTWTAALAKLGHMKEV